MKKRRQKSSRKREVSKTAFSFSKNLDDYLIEILREKRTYFTVTIDSVLKMLEKCNSMTIGPLSRLQVDLEDAWQSKTKCVSVSVSNLIQLTEKTVLLMGQTNNTISYHHRQSIDSSLMNPPQAKSKLKKRAPIPQSQDTDLFGKEFRQHLVESVKVKNNQRMCLSKYLRNIIT